MKPADASSAEPPRGWRPGAASWWGRSRSASGSRRRWRSARYRGGRAAVLAPAEERGDGPGVGGPRVGMGDVGGEEFEEAAGGVVARVGDDGGNSQQVARGPDDPGRVHGPGGSSGWMSAMEWAPGPR